MDTKTFTEISEGNETLRFFFKMSVVDARNFGNLAKKAAEWRS